MSEAALVTGAGNFLSYHVIKLLNEQGIRPRVLIAPGAEPTPGLQSLDRLDVERVEGDFGDSAALERACTGIHAVYHLHFVIDLSSGEATDARLRAGNVEATANLLDAAAAAGVSRVVVSSSALAIGLHHQAETLDETADWATCRYPLPYAESRREAEQLALSRPAGAGPVVVAVSPSFTMGPEDYVGAPANKLAMRMTSPKFRVVAPVGFGVLDVRDYADGAVRAARSGTHGRRYILSGDNVMTRELLDAVAAVDGREPPGWALSVPRWVIGPLVAILGLVSKLRGKQPKVSRELLDIWGRYAWYDTTLARTELGWNPRPLAETLTDSITWLRAHGR